MNTQLRWLVPAETTTKPPRLQVRSVNSIGQVIADWRDVPLVVAPEVGAGEAAKKCEHNNRECTYESDDGEFERWQCKDCGERWGVEIAQ